MKFEFDPNNREHVASRGSALKHLSMNAGWRHALDIMEKRCQEAEMELLKCDDPDPMKVFALQKEVKGMRTLYNDLLAQIDYFVAESALSPYGGAY